MVKMGIYNNVEIHPDDLAKLLFMAITHAFMDDSEC
jgi:hypothetical protein